MIRDWFADYEDTCKVRDAFFRAVENFFSPDGRFSRSSSVCEKAALFNLEPARMASELKEYVLSDSLEDIRKYSPQCHRFFHPEYEKFADNYSPHAYIEPFCAILWAPHASIAPSLTSALGSNCDSLFDSCFSQSQHHHLSFCHELAHAAGGGEPQAEKIASTLNRQAFASSELILLRADFRYAQPVMYYDKGEILEKYGWPCGQVIEEVLGWPQAAVDSMDVNQIKAIRHESYDAMPEAVYAVGKQVAKVVRNNTLEDFAAAAGRVLDDGIFHEGSRESGIAARFRIAAERLSAGPCAYVRPYSGIHISHKMSPVWQVAI